MSGRTVAASFLAAALIFTIAASATAQSSAVSGQSVADQIRDLRLALDALRDQLDAARRESEALRREIEALKDSIAQDADLLAAKVEDQEQTKVESASKHHVRLSGLALFDVVAVRGSVDNLDLPASAVLPAPGDAAGSFSAGIRQSMIGIELFGPMLAGAKTTAEVSIDFFGGFPSAADGVSSALLRLRTARISLDWPSASLVVGQDAPFFSPRSPTSLASTAYPAMSSFGNMWAWTPQVRVERRFAVEGGSTVALQGGILDPLTGEPPRDEYQRMATAGERSRLPALAARVAWQRPSSTGDLGVGAGTYYSRQNWRFDRTVNAVAVTADWDVPVGRWAAVSGELYRGRAIAGLGAGIAPSVLFEGAPDLAVTSVIPVDTAGGWLQVKVKPTARLEVNGAFGADRPSESSVMRALALNGAAVSRNASASLNAIFQARSNIVFSVEFRRLWTTPFPGNLRTADHVSVNTGVAF